MNTRPVNIGIHGPRNSGKTCYLAALYGKRSDADCSIAFADDESIDALKNLWEKLEHGTRPEATVEDKGYSFTLTCDGIKHKVQTHDYAGALIQRTQGTADALKADVKQWLAECDAIMVFVDVDEVLNGSPTDLRERANEIDLLINDLLDRRKTHISKPVLVALTKWDVYANQPSDREKEESAAEEFLREKTGLADLVTTVKNFSTDFHVIPVSSFGSHRDGNLPPEDGPRPFNTLRPFEWCAGRVSDIRAKQRKKRNHCILLLATLLLFIIGALLEHSSRSQYAAITRDLESGQRPALEMWHFCKSFQDAQNPLSTISGRRKSLGTQWQQYSERQRSAEFERLEPIRGNENSQELKQKCDQYDSFAATWQSLAPTAAELAEVLTWKTRATGLHEELLKDGGLKDKVATLKRSLDAEKDLQKKTGMIKDFLDTNPASTYPERCKPVFDDLEETRQSTLNAISNQGWQEVVRFIKEHPKEYSRCMDELDTFVTATDNPALRTSAAKERKRVEFEWDKEQYTALKNKALSASSYAKLKEVRDELQKYADSGRPQPTMAQYVRPWIKTFDALSAGVKCSVVITDMTIENGGPLDANDEWTFCLSISKGSITYKTDYLTGLGAALKSKKLGPFIYKPGDTLKVTLYRAGGAWRFGKDKYIEREIDPFLHDITLDENGQRGAKLILELQREDDKYPVIRALEDFKEQSDGGVVAQ